MAPDLGDLDIFEEPLVIHGIKAGGRRLTKALFMQLPDSVALSGNYIRSPEQPGSARAWVNIHWKDCHFNPWDLAYGSSIFVLGGAHRHVVCTDSTGRVFRGEVYETISPDTKPVIRLETHKEKASGLALLWGGWEYRWSSSYGYFSYAFPLNGTEFQMGMDDNYGPHIFIRDTGLTERRETTLEAMLHSHNTGTLKDLKNHWPADRDVAHASLEAIEEQVRNWRHAASTLWSVVAMEVPQVFL